MMTQQQEHLKNLLDQRNTLSQEIKDLQSQIDIKRSTMLKAQGAIEYLTQFGISLPEPEPSLESDEQVEAGLTPSEV